MTRRARTRGGLRGETSARERAAVAPQGETGPAAAARAAPDNDAFERPARNHIRACARPSERFRVML